MRAFLKHFFVGHINPALKNHPRRLTSEQQQLFIHCVKNSDQRRLESLIDEVGGIDFAIPFPPVMIDEDKITNWNQPRRPILMPAAQYAIFWGDAACLKVFLKHGLNPNLHAQNYTIEQLTQQRMFVHTSFKLKPLPKLQMPLIHHCMNSLRGDGRLFEIQPKFSFKSGNFFRSYHPKYQQGFDAKGLDMLLAMIPHCCAETLAAIDQQGNHLFHHLAYSSPDNPSLKQAAELLYRYGGGKALHLPNNQGITPIQLVRKKKLTPLLDFFESLLMRDQLNENLEESAIEIRFRKPKL